MSCTSDGKCEACLAAKALPTQPHSEGYADTLRKMEAEV